MAFLNLRISGRLYAGFGALVLFCAALAGFGVDEDALTVTPDRHGTDGFYARLFRRT